MTHTLSASFDAMLAVVPDAPLALFGIHLHVIEHVQRWMYAAGYPVLFGLLLSCGLGVPLPEDIPLLLAGYFVATGEMHLLPAAVCAWCGIIAGDCVLYAVGRRYGMAVTKVPVIGSHIKVEQIERMHVQFEKYGVWVVAIGRMFAGVRGAMVLVAGTIRFTFTHFLIADGLAAIVSGGLFMALGYYAGHKLGDLKHIHQAIEQYSMRVLLGLIVVGLIVGAWLYLRQRRRRLNAKGAGGDGVPRTITDRAADAAAPVVKDAPLVTAAVADSPALPLE